MGQVEMARTLVSTSRGTGRRSSTPLENSNAYMISNDERRFALVYTKVHDRLLRPLMAANTPPARLIIRQALKVLHHASPD